MKTLDAGSPEPSRDAINLRLSEAAKATLDGLAKDGYFAEMKDAYRLGIAYAIRHGLIDDADTSRPVNYLNVGSLDPQGFIRDIIIECYGDSEGPPYKVVERLAEAGITAMAELINYSRSLECILADAPS